MARTVNSRHLHGGRHERLELFRRRLVADGGAHESSIQIPALRKKTAQSSTGDGPDVDNREPRFYAGSGTGGKRAASRVQTRGCGPVAAAIEQGGYTEASRVDAKARPGLAVARRVVFSSSGDPTRSVEEPAERGHSFVFSLADGLLSVLFPSHCRLCQAPLTQMSRLPVCHACLANIRPIEGPRCAACGERLMSRHLHAGHTRGAQDCHTAFVPDVHAE